MLRLSYLKMLKFNMQKEWLKKWAVSGTEKKVVNFRNWGSFNRERN